MPPTKRQKRSQDKDAESESQWVSDAEMDEAGSSSAASSSRASSPDTEDEITAAQGPQKSKKTLKRKHRATEPSKFGVTLQSLLSTDTPSAAPLSLKPSIARRRNDEKLEKKAKQAVKTEKKDKEEKGRVKDVIGGWGGEGERALRKVAQRGVVQLFNAIQQSQAQASQAAEEVKAQRGSGKPTLPAPTFDKKKGKQKAKEKDNPLGRGKESALDKDNFLNMIRSGGVVSKS
ncbi:hypothetical protein EWM64_g6 [Hericium alpestre]|uniref:Rrp15p-domain-containing protein n=1 Tax=Hericium alpestre TaxID=135208 RepID=A0A4Z0ACD0_9AGAM|nr:hypothetical protein EWM64_g6 [Hericium alpestre]